MEIVVLAGGVGGARFLRGVRAVVEELAGDSGFVTAVVNTADDVTLHGLRVSPDLDSVMYTLGDGFDEQRGWGRRDETFSVIEEIRAYGVEPTWFGLGDRDIATHLIRTQLLDAGVPLSEVTAALCDRWQPEVQVLPMTDQRVETHVILQGEQPGTRRAVHFQEWWVRHGAALPAQGFVQVGNDDAAPAPGVIRALALADAILIAPSNPVVSIAPILGVPGMLEAVQASEARIVGVSPIVGGRPVRGMADACLSAIGVATSAESVGRWYGARGNARGTKPTGEYRLLDGWLVHDGDDHDIPGVKVVRRPLMMSDEQATASLVRATLELAGVME